MSHYVIIDGQLQKSSSATRNWVRRAAQAVPIGETATEAEVAEDGKKVAECDRIIGVHRSDWEIIQDLEENDV